MTPNVTTIQFCFFFFKQKTAYEMQRGLVGSEMCIRDRYMGKFERYQAGIGVIFLILIVTMGGIAVYASAIFAVELTKGTTFEDNQEYQQIMQDRLFYLTSSLIYLFSSTQNYMIYHPTLKIPYFVHWYSSLIKEENLVDKGDFPSNQEPVTGLIQSFTEGDFCKELLNSGAINTTELNYTWCTTIQDGLLKNGLKTTIYYIATDIQREFAFILLNMDSGSALTMYNDRLIYEYIIVPTFTLLISKAKNEVSKLIDRSLLQIVLLYSGYFVTMLIGIFVLIYFFIEKLNKELWNANGIIILFPLDLISSNDKIRAMFNQQMNIIV
eukprot:TRINITY_DN52690_c0_g1_i2.p1 TRINITY_DN52690_c0_g1~~TRINITY_DN52690_c0_g1_i2.p1  ORF type:complete len:325 (+),score=37.83 TRINITY_DN52690_c0_g1_i2:18-992(+)